MKRFRNIIISLLIIISLAGCGICNLNTFTLPNGIQFIECVDSLDTPQKISDYMVANFTYEKHLYYAYDPYTLFVEEYGDCNDFAAFGTFVANYHGYTTYQIEINFGTIKTHYLSVYDEGLYTFTDNRRYYKYFYTFRSIVECSDLHTGMEWKSYTVLNYDNQIIEKGYNNERKDYTIIRHI